MEEINYCSRCGAKWVAGRTECCQCGKILKAFRPTADYQYRPSVIELAWRESAPDTQGKSDDYETK